MRNRVGLAPRVLCIVTTLLGATLTAIAQPPARPDTARGWTVPRTPDGRPDLQGVWTNATLTPLERPANLRDRAFLTEAEATALEAQAAAR